MDSVSVLAAANCVRGTAIAVAAGLLTIGAGMSLLLNLWGISDTLARRALGRPWGRSRVVNTVVPRTGPIWRITGGGLVVIGCLVVALAPAADTFC